MLAEQWVSKHIGNNMLYWHICRNCSVTSTSNQKVTQLLTYWLLLSFLTHYCPTATFIPVLLKFRHWNRRDQGKNSYECHAYESVEYRSLSYAIYLEIWRRKKVSGSNGLIIPLPAAVAQTVTDACSGQPAIIIVAAVHYHFTLHGQRRLH